MSADPAPSVHRSPERLAVVVMGLLAFVPLLLSAPGRIAADTKAYLLLDPARLLDRAPQMWDTHVAAGTVTHQNIGYLFPLGPWYRFFDIVGVPTWIAGRLWFGTLLFAAGTGTIWVLRRLGLRGWGPTAAGFVYMLSPYVLAYMGRTSVILLPWAALPWLIGLMAVALRERTWRAPALFALLVTVMAGTNASSVVFVLLGPALLIPHMIWITHETEFSAAVRTMLRIAVLTVPMQLWWVAGLWVQGTYGLPILQLTETVETVAQTSTAPELMRGLGYWYFYGRDGLSQWTEAANLFTQNPGMLVLGFVLPILGLLAATSIRWRYRVYLLALLLTGLILGIGTHPYDAPGPLGAVIKFTTGTGAGFALRNSPRAVPLLVFALAGFIGAGLGPAASAIATRVRRRDRTGRHSARVPAVLTVAVIVIAVASIPPLWTGGFVQRDLQFPEQLPDYWTEAIAHLDNGSELRVLELPGSDFYAYRWGQTQDPITPGLMERPWVGRELTAFGTPGTVDLVRALDRRLQEGVLDPDAVAPVARLLSAADVLLRLDTQFERYRGPRPADLHELFGSSIGSVGLGPPIVFGPTRIDVADERQPTIDETELARAPANRSAPPLAIFPVEGTRPLVRAESVDEATVIWGDAEGLVDAAGRGLLPSSSSVFFSATLRPTPILADLTRSGRPSLIVTDSNRRRSQRWGTIRENNGATEAAASVPLVVDPKDTRLEVFPGSDDRDRTVAWFGPDVADVRASSYGNIVAHSAEARPVNAIDDDPRTAWSTGGYSDVVGERLRIDYTRPITTDHIDVLQSAGNRFITRLGVLLDGQRVATVATDDSSFVGEGQRVDLGGTRTFRSLELVIDAANVSGLNSYVGVDNVGLRTVRVPGTSATEWIRVPSEDLDRWAPDATSLTWLFSRWRADPVEGYRQDPELRLARLFEVPEPMRVNLQGQARLDGRADSSVIDTLLGREGKESGWAVVRGDHYLAGVPRARPSSALDGDPTTAWTTPFGSQVGRGFSVEFPRPTYIDALDLTIVTDERHSVPTVLELSTPDGTSRRLTLPDLATTAGLDSTTSVTIPVEPFVTTDLEVRILETRDRPTQEYFSRRDHALPLSIVELGLPVGVGPLPAAVPEICRTGLLTLDGTDVPLRLRGSVAVAEERGPVAVLPCTDDPLTLAPGEASLLTAVGLDAGLDVDQLELTRISAIGDTVATGVTDESAAAPRLVAVQTDELRWEVTPSPSDSPYWLVLGQSLSPGWKARVAGGPDLGEPVLIDGFANGWLVDPAVVGPGGSIVLEWTPQKVVDVALVVSALSGLIVIGIAIVTARRATRRTDRRDQAVLDGADHPPVPFAANASAGARSGRASLFVVGASTIVGFLLGGVPVAIGALVVGGLALRDRRRRVVALAPAVLVSLVALTYAAYQILRPLSPGVEWPTGFGPVHQLTLIAVVTLVIDTLMRKVRTPSDADSTGTFIGSDPPEEPHGSAFP